MSGKTAFVTGGTGFLGRHLIEKLLDQGWEVTALHRPTANTAWLEQLGVKLAPGQMDDPASLIAAMPAGLDAVFHVAGDTSFWRQNNKRQHGVNVIGTRNMLEAALVKKPRRFVHTSTIAVYGADAPKVTEDAPHQGRHSSIGYLKSKSLAEEEVKAAIARGLDAVIVNPCNIIGPYDTHNWSRLFRMVHEGNLPGVPPGSGSFCHASDVAQAHIAAYEKGRTGENYILGGPNVSHLEVIRVASRILGRPEPKGVTPAVLLKVLGAISQWVSYLTGKEPDLTPEGATLICAHQSVASDKASRELGYLSADLETMIADCIDWMKTERLLT